jgi:hypothetical protein
MISVRFDTWGRESEAHYDVSGKCFDPEIDRLGKVFQSFNLKRFGTFEDFTKEPGLFYSRASARGDFWEAK